MPVPFGNHPTVLDVAEWAARNGCKVEVKARSHAITGQPYNSFEIVSPKGGHVALTNPNTKERLEPSMVAYIQRRLGLKTPFAATPEPPNPKDTEYVQEDGQPFDPADKSG